MGTVLGMGMGQGLELELEEKLLVAVGEGFRLVGDAGSRFYSLGWSLPAMDGCEEWRVESSGDSQYEYERLLTSIIHICTSILVSSQFGKALHR